MELKTGGIRESQKEVGGIQSGKQGLSIASGAEKHEGLLRSFSIRVKTIIETMALVWILGLSPLCFMK